MSSLRNRLFAILVSSTGIIWIVATCWIYVGAKREIEVVLDSRLQEAARMASSIIPKGTQPGQGSVQLHAVDPASTERQLSCQIWSLDGELVARSAGAPETKLSDVPDGFSERIIDGERWRVFTIADVSKGVRVLVGDRLGQREHLVTKIIKGLLTPALFVVPVLAFLIWGNLHRGLMPLRNIASDLQDRNADDMSAITTANVPSEIRPLVGALNGLFRKVELAWRHEREITAFATHELRTPLAGLRMHAQIAIATSDQAVRDAALKQILTSVDRTTRLVRQLLALSKLDSCSPPDTSRVVNVGEVLVDIVSSTPSGHVGVDVVVDPGMFDTIITTNRELLTLALRNLHENAINHTGDVGIVRWSVENTRQGISIAVEDQGPGIPVDEIELVTNRFFRGRHKSASGSGLGLAIVKLALDASGASLAIGNRADVRGLRVEATWPGERRLPRPERAGDSSTTYALPYRFA